jgi:putative component of membrane protein insertase Oxa1/YidC/SpoIIIJ protein YidD
VLESIDRGGRTGLKTDADPRAGRSALPRIATKLMLAVAATPFAVGAFVFVLGLMKWAPSRREILKASERDREDSADPVLPSRAHNSWLIELFVFFYRHSLFGMYLNRNGPRCCFVPSCTEYAIRAVGKYGLRRGLLLTGDRFRRCTPLDEGAYVDFP